jgi:1-acyl-sn-glycerol-3-phosphate acyltransferase
MRSLFFALLRLVFWFLLGLEVRGRLPARGPAIVAANHNSHLDVFVLLALLPLGAVRVARPVAAADYFRSRPMLDWITTRVLRTIHVERGSGRSMDEVLAPVVEALDRGEIVILFPEGTRGRPERLGRLRRGIARLAELRPGVPIHPVILRGLGKVLPKGSPLFVPFVCRAEIEPPLAGGEDAAVALERLFSGRARSRPAEAAARKLAGRCSTARPQRTA